MDKRLILIDGNSLINRAYYAMQKPMMTKDGLYTQGVYGFLNMLAKIKKDYDAGYIAVAFDKKAPTFRHKEFEGYKAGRRKMPPELAMQMPLLKDVLSAMNIKMLEMDGFEADDIIGTLADKGEKEGLFPLIITGDKDELQLASDLTQVIITRKGISEFDLYDGDVMRQVYGFGPERFVDYKGLMGDPSDNIPGLPGVGEKTARKLIHEFGTVEGLLERVDDVTPARIQNIVRENGATALMSKRLATIVKTVPVDVDFRDFRWEEPDLGALTEQYVKLEFNSFLRKLSGAPGAKPFPVTGEEQMAFAMTHTAPSPTGEAGGFASLRNIWKKGNEIILRVFHDNSHVGPPFVRGAGIVRQGAYYFIPGEEIPELAALFSQEPPSYVGHDLKEDYYALMHYGLKAFETAFDTAIAQYLLDSARSSYPLKVLAQEYLGCHMTEDEDLKAAGLEWCSLVSQIRTLQDQRIQGDGMERVFREVELPLIEPMAFMEFTGFRLDTDALKQTGAEIQARINALTTGIIELAGTDFNINSPAQLGPVLFERLGLPAGKKTKTGYSTSADVLENLKDQHEIVPLILEYRMLTKLRGTYIDGLLPLVAGDGKIHAHFNQTVAATGRISSTEPNLQNIPIRQEQGRLIRKAFIPTNPDFLLLAADYSQIELRILAHLSKDPALAEAFNSGTDIHKATASRVLGIPEDEITLADRTRTKAVNFGVIYGMSSFGLSTELNISRKEADDYIKEYFKKHEAVKSYMDGLVALAKKDGYVTTIMGRRRYIPEIGASNYMVRQLGERLAMNSPIQGSAADIIKIAMNKVYCKLRDGGYQSRLILQVHDELILEVHRDELNRIKPLLKDGMEQALALDVKVEAAENQGENWYELK